VCFGRKIALRIILEEPLAGGAAEIECLPLIGTALPGGGYLYYHTTDGVNRGRRRGRWDDWLVGWLAPALLDQLG
jgi:hypothetical protein